MKALLDTHALLWWLDRDPALSEPALAIIRDPANDIFVSAASIWEVATKLRLGKLTFDRANGERLPGIVREQGFELISINAEHAHLAGWLQGSHNEPFDRMLAAQAQIERLSIVSRDRAFDALGVQRVW